MQKEKQERLLYLVSRLPEDAETLAEMVENGEGGQVSKAHEIQKFVEEIVSLYTFEASHEIHFHPNWTAQLYLPDLEIMIAGKERLELHHDGQWVTGRTGCLVAGQIPVLFPDDQGRWGEYLSLPPGSLVRRVVVLDGSPYLPKYDRQYRQHEACDIPPGERETIQ